MEHKSKPYPAMVDVYGLPSNVFALWQVTIANPIYIFERRRKLVYPTIAIALFGILYGADVLLSIAIINAVTSKRVDLSEVMWGLGALFAMRAAICSINVVMRTRQDVAVRWVEQLRILPLPRRCLIWGKALPYIETPLMLSFGIMVLALPLLLSAESDAGTLLLCHALLRWAAVCIFWIATAPAGAFIGLYCALATGSNFTASVITTCVIIAIAFAVILMGAFDIPPGAPGNWWLDLIIVIVCISAVTTAVVFYYLSWRHLS